jgi:hypothetical protein
MKKLMTVLGVTIIASFIIISCGQNSNKQKELELKERELKEKEISLKEKDTTNLKAVVQDTLKNETVQETKKLPSDTKVLTMTFEDYEEGDFPHLIFKDISTGEDYDFMFLSDNNLNGISILLEDDNAAFGLKANPKYLKKSFIVETKKKLVEQYDLEGGGGTYKTKAWVITSIKLK